MNIVKYLTGRLVTTHHDTLLAAVKFTNMDILIILELETLLRHCNILKYLTVFSTIFLALIELSTIIEPATAFFVVSVYVNICTNFDFMRKLFNN